MINKENIILTTIASMLILLSLGVLHTTKVNASMPTNTCSLQTLRKNGFTKNTIPKKYRGTWYTNEVDKYQSKADSYQTKVTKNTFLGNKVKVSNKAVKIKGKYQLPIYDLHQQLIIYLHVSGNKSRKITMAYTRSFFENKNIVNKNSNASKHIIYTIPGYVTKHEAKSHSFYD